MKLNWRLCLASGLTPEEVLEQEYLSGHTDAQTAALLTVMSGIQISGRAVTIKRQSMGLGKSRAGVPLVLASRLPRFDRPPTVGGDVLVLEDLHFPAHDAVFINRCLDLADLWDLRLLVLAGDVLDLIALSDFAPEFGEDKPSLEEEFAAARQFLDACQGFDKVLWLGGNHERRFLRRLGTSASMSSLAAQVLKFSDFTALETSDYHYCFHEAGWLFGHPDNVNAIPGRVPQFLARKFPNVSIATGHGHLWGMTQTEDGERLAVDIGVACDPKRTGYKAMRLNTRPNATQGAFVLKRGKPWLLSPFWTDWAALRSINWGL